jgi:tRNA modification GTPase
VDAEPIAAVATPPGRGALAVVRVSGAGAGSVLGLLTKRSTFTPRHATRVTLHLGEAFHDDALATWFPAPHSYTGEDSFELGVHGSPVVTAALLDMLGRQGVRVARPGEFTLRAFLHGKIDLVEAEAVADLVRAVTPAQARMAAAHLRGAISGPLLEIATALLGLLERLEASLDFPDEGYHFVDPDGVVAELRTIGSRCAALIDSGTRGRLLRDGAAVAVVGRPNVGKSSLFNALLGHARAIVTDVPGTTRDVLHETIDLGGVPVVLIDTAGLCETVDAVEREGVRRAEASASDADVVVVVVDGSERDPARAAEDASIWERHRGRRRCLVVNKVDAMDERSWSAAWAEDAVPVLVSALTGDGIDDVRAALALRVGQEAWEPGTITNARHLHLLGAARAAVERGIAAALDGATEEYVAVDVRDALHALEEIRGRVTSQEVLDGIFARFCIGK